MAEEIVGGWDNLNDLILDLAAEGGDRPPERMNRVAQRIREVLDDPVKQSMQMQFRLEDSEGNPIKFPLRVVANTSFG